MGGKSSTPQTTTQITQAQIPEFLMPYLQQQMGIGTDALTSLQTQLNDPNAPSTVAPVAPLNQNQLNANRMVVQGATSPDGLLQTSIDRLKDVSRGGYIDKMMPTFNAGVTNGIEGDFLGGSVTNPLASFAGSAVPMDATARSALTSTASGANLYGTPAFDAAVDASVRSARPSILSGFAGAGAGAIKGGLAQSAIQRSASDAFASLYGQERDRQMGAASALGNFDLSGRGQQIDAAGTLGNLNLGQQGLRNQATGMLANALNAERDRQVGAAQSLPGIGLLGASALAGVGEMEQGQAQAQLDAETLRGLDPITRQQILLAAAQGVPIGQLIGQTSTQNGTLYRNRGAGAAGGALSGAATGAQIGGPWGALAGAIGGGLLGAYG